MLNSDDEDTSRRSFLQTAAVSILSGVAVTACSGPPRTLEPSAEQRAFKRKGKSKVCLAQVADYENVEAALAEAWKQTAPSVKNKTIFLKVNLVDYRQGLPVYTNPAVVEATINVLKEQGAREIKVGDGPALNRDTEEIARLSGIAQVCKKHSVEFIDLNLDDLDKKANQMNFTGVNEFVLPRSITRADLVISMPKLKTHRWALMTCSMKNMFGVIPGRKYGWPKNILHVKGIDKSIVDIVTTVKPGFAIVDGIVAMEGDGPLDGTAKDLQMIVLGDDLAAVDTVCALCMQLPVDKIQYLRIAGMVLGNIDLANIEVLGKSIESMKQKFLLPPTFRADGTTTDLSKYAAGAEKEVT